MPFVTPHISIGDPMNPLADYPGARKVAYLVATVLGLALGAAQVGFSAADAGQPTWLTVALAVYAFLGGALGITAASNIGSAPADEEV